LHAKIFASTIVSGNRTSFPKQQILALAKVLGNGGDIKVGNPLFVILNKGRFVARADEGQGGNISL
jgi:hypothetical protein